MKSFPAYTNLEVKECFKIIKSRAEGLTSEEAARRLALYGPNRLEKSQVHWWPIMRRQLASPFLYLLFAADLIAFLLGHYLDAVTILFFILVSAFLGFYQEYRSEKAVKILQGYLKRLARIRRGGVEKVIEAADLVPGDVVILQAGDALPADVRFTSLTHLVVDESILTGESAAVPKQAAALDKEVSQIHQAQNIGFLGTSVTEGYAEGVVLATGPRSTLGSLSKLTLKTQRVSPFERGIAKFSYLLIKMVGVTLALVFLANLLIKGASFDPWDFLLFAIALAVGVVPEALPVVTTFALSQGALRLAKKKVVVKRLAAIEDLGSVDVLCTDKTGTITENKLVVAEVLGSDQTHFWGLLASTAVMDGVAKPTNNFDAALWETASEMERRHLKKVDKLAEIPFDPRRRCNSVLVKNSRGRFLIVRGAPEVVEAKCLRGEVDKKKLKEWVGREGKLGRRTLAVARKSFAKAEYFDSDESDLEWVGCLSFVDPFKKSAARAIGEAQKLGLEVKILTGDGLEVAEAVGREVGLVTRVDQVMQGEEFARLEGEQQAEAVERVSVFARVGPEEKFKIIEVLQKKHTVGFLGEGFNDAPALKLADVALVVQGAADIAQDAADVILLNQSLAVIVDGIREGRRTFANTIKYIKNTLTSNFGNFYAVAIVSLFTDYLPMLPIQILLVNLLSDFPMIAVAGDSVDEEDLQRPNEYRVQNVALVATVLGIVSTLYDFLFFAIFRSYPVGVVQTMWFVESIFTELVLIFSLRTRQGFLRAARPGKILVTACLLAGVATLALPWSIFGQEVFHFVRPTGRWLVIVAGLLGAYFVNTELVKLWYYRHFNHS